MYCSSEHLSPVSICQIKKIFIFSKSNHIYQKLSEYTNLTGICKGRGKYIVGKTNARYGARSAPPGSTYFTFQIRDIVLTCVNNKTILPELGVNLIRTSRSLDEYAPINFVWTHSHYVKKIQKTGNRRLP